MCDELIKEHLLDYLVGDKDYWKNTFKVVINELSDIIDCWCDEQLCYVYNKSRHQPKYIECKNTFKGVGDYEEYLHINFEPHVVFEIINDNFDITKQSPPPTME